MDVFLFVPRKIGGTNNSLAVGNLADDPEALKGEYSKKGGK